MKDDNFIDTSLDLVSDTIGTFDKTLGNVPIYKSGHEVGTIISDLINKIVDSIPVLNK